MYDTVGWGGGGGGVVCVQSRFQMSMSSVCHKLMSDLNDSRQYSRCSIKCINIKICVYKYYMNAFNIVIIDGGIRA